MPLEFLSLFAGAGGLDLGLERSGWRCRYGVDSDPEAVETLRLNRGDAFGKDALFECADVRELSGDDILGRIGRKRGEVPLMAGGPPCQSWSSAGKQLGFEDPRGRLFADFVRLSDECGCRIIVFENVRGLLTARGPNGVPGEALRIIRETLFERGYRSDVRLLNAADYGVPQRRVRLIIVAYRDTAMPVFPVETHAKSEECGLFRKPWATLSQVLEQAAPIKEHELIRPAGEMAIRLSGLKPGEGAKSPGKRETTRPGGHWGYLQGGFVADPSLPARTVTASSQQDWIMLDDGTHRRLTPRECALIQTFPEDWRFAGNRASQYRLIGNAVPPRLAEALGATLAGMLQGAPYQAAFHFELPPSLAAAIRYTAREESRNGESRRVSSPVCR